MDSKLLILVAVILFNLHELANGHGRLIDPPSRSTAWRYGFNTTVNYDDNQLFCGGKDVQWNQNGGKCGICGDPYNGPRENEVPNGKYAKDLVIVRKYKPGQAISAVVQITANHLGYFVFKMCPAKDNKVEVTQECLDKNQLRVLNSSSKTQFMVNNPKPGNFTARLALPEGLTCNRCVFQWTYTAGNSWGKCENGTYADGCGPQETYRACADVSIL